MIEHARRLISKYATRGIIIDSNLLFVFLVGAANRELVGKYHRTDAYTPAEYDLLAELIAPAQRIVITPHVGAEISNLAGRKRTAPGFGDRFVHFLRSTHESYMPSASLAKADSFLRLGLTDAAIAQCSLRRRRLLVVTADLPLAVFIERAGGPVINFNHLRQFASR